MEKEIGRTGKGKEFARRTAEELTPGHAMRQRKISSFANPPIAIIQARANDQTKKRIEGLEADCRHSPQRFCRPYIGQ